MRTTKLATLAALTALQPILCEIALAQTSTPAFTIKKLRTGWAADTFYLESNDPILNPMNCRAADGYGADASAPGYKTFLATALTAHAAAKQVVVVVSDAECIVDRPKIIGIYLQ